MVSQVMLLNWGHSWDVAHLGVVLPAVTAGMRQEIKGAATAETEEGLETPPALAECGYDWWRQGKLLQLSPQIGSKGYEFREGFKKINKSSRAVGTTCPKCLRTHRSEGCTG